MNLFLKRLHHGDNSTIGALYANGEFQCFTCEDEPREVKVPGKTRIPSGKYQITYRDIGGMVERYKSRMPWHKGMLWLRDVPNFDWIYLHIGNYHTDTDGCILVGDTARNGYDRGGWVEHSTVAYERLYKMISRQLDCGIPVSIVVQDEPVI